MAAADTWWDWFPLDYADSRQRFIRFAEQAGAQLQSHQHPSASGPNRAPLWIDVARIGAPTASRLLLVLSGTHGLEAPAGAAVQNAWLAGFNKLSLGHDVAVVLVHALNPYGFAHWSRTTENNVDLNRNFVDHNQPHPANADFAALYKHKALTPTDWGGPSQQAARQVLAEYAQQHGDDALFNARAKGQYAYPEGPSYGGQAREWSNEQLQRIVEEHVQGAQIVGLIDWHTGLGDYALPFFLCFSDEGSAEQQEAERWWGSAQIIGQRPNGLARPDYQGLVFRGVQAFIGDRPLVGAVVEFGTRTSKTGEAVQLDQWLRFQAPQYPDAKRDAQLQADLQDAFVPFSSVWRRAVIHHGLEITAQALAGLQSWSE